MEFPHVVLKLKPITDVPWAQLREYGRFFYDHRALTGVMDPDPNLFDLVASRFVIFLPDSLNS
jgi:hypothetical protein